MEQEGYAGQRGEVLHPEDLRDQAARDRHRAEPEEADRGGEQVHGERGERQHDEDREYRGAREVERREHVLLGVVLPEPAPHISAEDIEQPDQRQCHHAGLRRHALVDEVGGEVHRDEHQLEAAHEIARAQQHVAVVAECFAQCLRDRLLARLHPRADVFRERGGERQNQEQRRRADEQRVLPAEVRNQCLAVGHHQELSE